jgi:predicted nucleic acid-binding protein
VVVAGRETLHELYYVLSRGGTSVDQILSVLGGLTAIPNLRWVATDFDADLLALSLMKTYGLTSIFDAYQAATCLLHDPDKLIVSTDHVYDAVRGLSRRSPETL